MKKINEFFVNFKARFSIQEARRAIILFYFQNVLILMLITLAIMVLILQNEYVGMYLSIIGLMSIVLLTALSLNIKGKYHLSAIITVICSIAGPWISIFFDEGVRLGDVMPLMYVIIIILLSSIFLSMKTTIWLSLIQLIGISVFTFSSPAIMEENVASMLSFFIIATILVGLASYMNKQQMEQIEIQNQQYVEKEKEMRELLIHDNMTGLFNRTYINEIFNSLVQNQRYALFLIDIDGLKEVNDHFGHLEGDQMIIQTANLLKESFRESDIVARMGGDEFLAILSNSTEQNVKEIVRNLEKNLKKYNDDRENHLWSLDISYGYAIGKAFGEDIELLMKKADEQMYSHKNLKEYKQVH